METKDQITEFKSFFESHVDVERKSIETAIKEREAFLSEYPLSRLKELSIDEYCIGTEQSKNSLCYLIEFGKYKHTGFGIGGGSSKKYGVYYNKTEQCYKHGNTIIENIAGRKIENLYPHSCKPLGESMLEIKNLSGEKFKDVSMKVQSGEIVGVAGLVGAGRSEVVRAAYGVDNYSSGEVYVCGKKLTKHDPARANRLGMCLLPEDRKVEGLALSLSIRENTVISSLGKMNPRGVIAGKKEHQAVKKSIDDLEIATSSMEKLVRFLSGGTQQKVVVAKWLMSQSKVFIFDEPTRGIDVGAKTSIYQLMDDLVSQGAAILMISSDLPEVLGMSDRIYVMSGGKVVGEVDKEHANQNDILQLAFSNV